MLKDFYIPVFTNKPSDYREWRQRIQLYRKKLELQNKGKEAVLNVLTSLHGVAWRQIESKVDGILAKEQGAFDLLISELDTLFRYNEDVEMPRAFEKFFYGLNRKPDQTLMAYVADHRQALHEVEKHGVQISDKVSGWILLRRAGLTTEQKQLIQSQCPKLSYDKIVETMFFLLGQDYKGKITVDLSKWRGRKIPSSTSSRWSRGYGYVTEELYDPEETYDDEFYHQWDEADDYAYAEWEEEPETYEEPDEPTYAAHEQDDMDFPDDQQGNDDQLEEAYATYLDARRHFAQLKAARGYFPVVALTDGGMQSMPASSQAPKGPSKGGKGKGKSKGKSSRKGPPPQKGSATARADAARCFKCLQVGHWSQNCPNRPAKASPTTSNASSPTKRAKTESAMMMHDLTQPSTLGTPSLSEAGWYGLQDGGASSVVCGHTVLMKILDYLVDKGVTMDKFLFAATNKTFGFGGDANRQADWSIRLPVWIQGRSGYLECFIVEGSTPLLIGRPILKALNVKIDYMDNKMSINGSEWEAAILGERGEYLLRLDDGLADNLECLPVNFDYVTTETCAAISNYEDLDSYVGLRDYLSMTERSPPETALLQVEDNQDDADEPHQDPLMPEDDPQLVRREITDKLIKTMHMEFNRYNKNRLSTLEQALRAHEKHQKIFWEVYSGSGNLSTVMESEGWLVQRFDYTTGWDFDLSEHRRAFLQMQDEVCPDFVWYAPKCTEWSPMQNLNIYTEERREALEAERIYQEKVHLKLCRRSYLKQNNEGRHGAIEQPRFAVSWKTKTWSDLPGHECWLDQCQFGVKLPNSQGVDMFVKKPTRLQCTDSGMAFELAWLCPGDHEHLPLEGSSPGIGSRTAAAATYQFVFCQYLAKAINHVFNYGSANAERALTVREEAEMEGDPRPMDRLMVEEAFPAEGLEPEEAEHPANRGVLQRLQEHDRQAAKRTITRLHRNLGHPTTKELIRLLKSKNASEALLTAAQEHQCGFCELHQRPSGVPVSSTPKDLSFNDRVQMDTLWIQVPNKKHKQLMMSDAVTRLIAARHLHSETSEEYIRQIEKTWINFFGPMKVLQVDEHRAWSSDSLREWATEQGIKLVISPGQAHTRLAILERRHQVTRRAVSIFLEANPDIAKDKDGLKIALNYVVPQLNRMPNVHGFSPLQWVLGYTPHVPGLLT